MLLQMMFLEGKKVCRMEQHLRPKFDLFLPISSFPKFFLNTNLIFPFSPSLQQTLDTAHFSQSSKQHCWNYIWLAILDRSVYFNLFLIFA